jgi:hypothetical protein
MALTGRRPLLKKIVSGAFMYILIQGFAVMPNVMAQEADHAKEAARPSFTIGANFWYTWWRPAWEKIRVEKLIPWWHINPEIDATVEFGINAAVRFNDSWIIATVLNFGEYGVTVQKYFPLPFPIKPKFESKAQRFDLDASAGYSINQYVMFLAGLKYRGCMVRLRYIRSYSFNSSYAGPEAGFGFTIPIVSSLFFTPVVSGIIMGGREGNGSSAQAGCVISGAVAYKTLSSRMIISIGGRYEYLKYISRVDPYYNRDSGQVYGMTITLAFVF